MSVYRAVYYKHALFFGSIGTPEIVFFDYPADIFSPYGTVQRTYEFNIQRARFFQKRLYLYAILSHDIRIVSSCLVYPSYFKIRFVRIYIAAECPESTESVRRIKHLIGRIVGYHSLGPMHHRSHSKSKSMSARTKSIALFYDDFSGLYVKVEKLRNHNESLEVADNFDIGILFYDCADASAVVGLHMIDHEIVEFSSRKHVFDILEKLKTCDAVDGIHKYRLVIEYEIGIVAYAVFNGIDVFKQSYLSVIDAYPIHIGCNFLYAVHNRSLI